MWRLVKEWLRFVVGDWFVVHRRERDGYIAWTVLLLIGVALFNWWVPKRPPAPPPVDSSALAKAYQRLRQQTAIRPPYPFDPNRVTAEFLIQMNVRPGLARRWENYLRSGGRFRTAEDLLRLYGMDSATWNALRPALRFPPPPPTKSRLPEASARSTPSAPLPKADLNRVSDTALAEVVPSWLARRIVKYRFLLGGYVRWEQLLEVYGMKPHFLRKLRRRYYLPDSPLRPLYLNRFSYYRLRRHPYITDSMARAVVQRRRWIGAFDSIGQLYEVWDSAAVQRLAPYLRVE